MTALDLPHFDCAGYYIIMISIVKSLAVRVVHSRDDSCASELTQHFGMVDSTWLHTLVGFDATNVLCFSITNDRQRKALVSTSIFS